VARRTAYPLHLHNPSDQPALHSFPPRRSSDLYFAPSAVATLPAIISKSPNFARNASIAPAITTEWPWAMSITSTSVPARNSATRSEEHTSELQSRGHLVCRLLLEKKKIQGRPL